MNKEINRKVLNIILLVMTIVSSMLVLQVFHKELFLLIQILFVVLAVFVTKKIPYLRYFLPNFIFGELFLSALSAAFSAMPDNYRKTAFNLAIMLIPLYFTVAVIEKMLRGEQDPFSVVRKGLKIAVLVQLGWATLQLIFKAVLKVDINKLIFTDILHMVENATFIRSYVWYPSGLNWHSAVLGPLFVMGLLLFDNNLIRLWIILIAALCGNSTCFIGVLVCAFCLVVKWFLKRRKSIRKRDVLIVVAILLGVGVLAFKFDLIAKLTKVITDLYVRLFGAEKDASTNAHFGYYKDYFDILKISNPFQILFGYGYGCSGYTITLLQGRYSFASTWAIESDIVNIIVSRGIVGFIGYYAFLVYLFIKGLRVDYRYAILMFVIILQGFGYNVQFDYVLFVELLLFISIKNGVNFFNSEKIRVGEPHEKESIRHCSHV